MKVKSHLKNIYRKYNEHDKSKYDLDASNLADLFKKNFDEYGSSKIETRIRLAMEIVTAIKKRKSVNLPISYYFSIAYLSFFIF